MNLVSIIFTVLVCHSISAEEEIFTTCPELKGSNFESFSNWLSTKKAYNGSKFYVALHDTNNKEGLFEIKIGNLSTLRKEEFDISLKTYVIIHGYRSFYKKPWVLEMKDKILKKEKVNLILVDWSSGSYSWNYIDSVRMTNKVSNDLAQLFLNMKDKLPKTDNGTTLWNHLYFIGHSLGAHIAGQTGYLLKKADEFFKIERITGLDPARPCFIRANVSMKLDKTDADFVDVIHTQTGQGQKTFGFGLKEPIGHVDFYVNGGVLQPACQSNSIWKKELDNMFCSHRMSYRYFIDSLDDSISCKFVGHRWDETYTNAVEIFENVKNNKSCSDCLEMGIHVTNQNGESGTFLVFTSTTAPQCSLKDQDIPVINEKLKLLELSKNETSLWNIIFDTDKKKS